MDFEHSEKVRAIRARLAEFMDAHVYPSEEIFEQEVMNNRWAQPPVMEKLMPLR